MNPSTTVSNVMHDVLPARSHNPAPVPQHPNPHSTGPAGAPVKAELVQNIPVKSQDAGSANPAGSLPQPGHGVAAQASKALDHEPQTATKTVEDQPVPKKNFAPDKQAKPKKTGHPSAVAPIALAFLVAGGLIAAAVYAFSQEQSIGPEVWQPWFD